MSGFWIAIDFAESEEGGTSTEFIPKFYVLGVLLQIKWMNECYGELDQALVCVANHA